MSKRRKIPDSIRQQVAERAHYRCSYCQAPAQVGIPMVVDHIIPLSAGGHSEIENLCLSCYRCNEFKGPRISAADPVTQQTVAFFNPNTQTWTDHFTWSKDSLRMIGLTAVGEPRSKSYASMQIG